MPSILDRFSGFISGAGARQRTRPFKEMGVSGTAVWGGFVQTKELNSTLTGQQKWDTYADIVANTSIVGAGTRYFLNLIGHAEWSVEPVDDTPEAIEAAEFMEDVMHDMHTSWSRIVRRSAMYRFNGFGIQEWTAKRREDGKIGFADIESRPSHTIERWDVDERGTVIGMWQRAPQTGDELYLPRDKVLYLVDDALTDSPEGTGLFRHLVDPARRLKEYLRLEGTGYSRDMRGVPVGRAPYLALAKDIKDGHLSSEEAKARIGALEQFVRAQAKDVDSSLTLDSSTYVSFMDNGRSISTTPQWGIELLKGGSGGFADMGKAIDRLNREMARILGVEQLMLGDGSGGNRALSEDKSRGLFMMANSTLSDIGDALDRDVIGVIWKLNGLDEKLRPKLKHSDISFRAVSEITASLRDMATAGAVLSPDDDVINNVRDALGVSRAPEIDPEEAGMLPGNTNRPNPDPDGEPNEDDDDDEFKEAA